MSLIRGTNYLFALTTTTDEITGEVKPLFAFPVQACKGVADDAAKFDVAAPSGAKRAQKYMDTATGEIVEDADCPRGVFVGDEFKPIDKEQIDAINAEEKLTTMVALGRVPLVDVLAKYGDRIVGRYFLQSPAKGGSAKAYRLTYEALMADTTAIVTKRTKTSKQALSFVYADAGQGCLVMCDVVFASQIREADEAVKAPQKAVVEQAQIEMARKVIAAMADGTDAFDTEMDEANERKRDLIEAAVNGEKLSMPVPVANTVENDDLGAMLAASLA